MSKQFIRNHQRQRRGVVTILTALGMVTLLGLTAFCIDYGTLVKDANKAQQGVDAAAIAGALEYSEQLSSGASSTALVSPVTAEAVAVAGRNGVTITSSNVNVDTTNKIVTVTATINQNYFFARILGLSSGSVTRQAKAQPSGRKTGVNVVPIGITISSYNAYKDDTSNSHTIELCDHKHGAFGTDQFVCFDMRDNNAKSPPHFVNQLTGVDQVNVDIGDYTGDELDGTDSATALNAKSTDDFLREGMATLFQRAAGSPWYDSWTGNVETSFGTRYSEILAGTAPAFNPRIMYMIVTDDQADATKGTFDAPIRYFVPVYVEKCIDDELTIRFLPLTTSGLAPSTGASLIG